MISHATTPAALTDQIKVIATRITQAGDKPYVTVTKQLELLQQLSEFEFGRFLIVNQGINGYWTHYMLTHPWFGRNTGKNQAGEPLHPLESFLLDRSPVLLATQERFQIFLKENQTQVKNHARLACVAGGMMNELLYLNYQDIQDIDLLNIDIDTNAFAEAKNLASQKGLSRFVQCLQKNAWQLNAANEYDLISCNGLTIYEPSDERVTALFRQFHQALKPGAKLATSFLTFPPTLTDSCEWDMTQINGEDLLLQKILLADIVGAKFQNYRSSALTKDQLETAGFRDIQFIYDKAKDFSDSNRLQIDNLAENNCRTKFYASLNSMSKKHIPWHGLVLFLI